MIFGLTRSSSNFYFQTRLSNLLVTHRKLSDVFQGAFRGTENPRFPPAHVEKVNILTQADPMSKKMTMARKVIFLKNHDSKNFIFFTVTTCNAFTFSRFILLKLPTRHGEFFNKNFIFFFKISKWLGSSKKFKGSKKVRRPRTQTGPKQSRT